jgi:hypothetical protein
VTACAARPQAEMVLTGFGGPATLTVSAWQSAVSAPRPGYAWPTGDWQHTAALAGHCAAARLEMADVIICADRLRNDAAAEWLGAMLDRYPGCAVAAAGTSDLECVVGARSGPPVNFALGACAEVSEPGWLALLCASFAHWWLAGAGPLAELGPTQVRVTASGAPACWRLAFHGGAVLSSLGIAGSSASRPRASSRCRICSSSGASTSA